MMGRGRLGALVLLVTFLLVVDWSSITVDGKEGPRKSNLPLTGSKKLLELQKLVHKSLVPFTNELFGHFAVRPERPYHLFLLFTTTSSTTNCDMCKQVVPEYELLAKSYEGAKLEHGSTRDGLAIFFGVVEFDTNQKAFETFRITSAPHVVYVAPDQAIDENKKIPTKVTVEPRNVYNVFSQGKEAELMAAFVKQRTGLEYTIQRSKTFLYVLLVVAVGILAAMAKWVADHQDFVLAKLRRKQLWMTVSLLFYGLSVSGMVFCIIREPPPFAADNKGNIQYFHPQGRQQFVYEGLIIGGLDVTSAVFMILLSQWAVYVRNPAMRYLAIVGCMLGFVFMYRQMTDAYKFKNRWYTGWMGF